jgi:hypothetical protein
MAWFLPDRFVNRTGFPGLRLALSRTLKKYRRKSHETDLSTQQGKAEPQIRLPRQNENKRGEAGTQTPQGKGQV